MHLPRTLAVVLLAACGPSKPAEAPGPPDVPRAKSLLEINWTEGPYATLEDYCARLERLAGPATEAVRTYDELPSEDVRVLCNDHAELGGTTSIAGRGPYQDVRIVAKGEHLVRCQLAMKTAEGYFLAAEFDCHSSDHPARDVRTVIDEISFVGDDVVVRWTTTSTLSGRGLNLQAPDEDAEMHSVVSFIQVCGTDPNVRCIDPIPTRATWSGFADIEGSYETTVEVGDGWIVLDGAVGGNWSSENYARYGHNRFLDEVRGLHIIEWK